MLLWVGRRECSRQSERGGDRVTTRQAILATAFALLLTSCGRSDASGIYVSASDRGVSLVQLVQTKDGVLTGRLQEVSVRANGEVEDQSVNLDGAVSKHDLLLKSSSAWYGGLTATGRFTNDGITLTGSGFTLRARRSSFEKYQTAVAHLQSVAANDRQRIADARAAQIAQEVQTRANKVQAQAIQDAADKTTRIKAASVELRNSTVRLSSEIAAAPDFGRQSAANTALIAKMMRVAATVSSNERDQMVEEANQVVAATNQIEVARSQYAMELNQIVQQAGPLAQQVQQFCGSPEGSQFSQPCIDAKAAAAEFFSALDHGRSSFNGYKQTVQSELAKQSAMVQRMGG